MSKATQIFEKQATIIRHIGEERFLQYLNEISLENNLTLFQQIAETTASVFEIDKKYLLDNISNYDRNLTPCKDVFIVVCLDHNLKKDLSTNGYYKQRLTKAKNNINTLIEKNPQHKLILEKLNKIKTITNKNLNHGGNESK